MLHIGAWVDSRIRHSVVEAAGASVAHQMQRSLKPYLSDIVSNGGPNDATRISLGTLIDPTSRHGILEVNVWFPDERLIYTSRYRNPPVPAHATSAELTVAAKGGVVAHFDDDHEFDPKSEVPVAVPVFNVYAPLRDPLSNRVVAIAEVFQDATVLSRELTIARQHSWLVVGSLTAAMLALLFGIVHSGSALIFDQQQALEAKIAEQSRLLRQNELLRTRLTHAHQSSHLVSDKLLMRVSADLHDGPAQLIGLALLRLDDLAPSPITEDDATSAFATVRSSIQDALCEIRSISTGLALPQIEQFGPTETLLYAITSHERRTGTTVARALAHDLPSSVALSIRICLFRGVQEGLNNAFRHAKGIGQSVKADFDGATIRVTVSDSGPGFSVASLQNRDEALGLVGLRHRVESLGGSLELVSLLGKGTTITMAIPHRGAA